MITDEQSKAVQEVAKTTGQFAEISEKVGGFVSKVIGRASNQVGGILEDWTRYYRFKNLAAIADKVEAIHTKRILLGKTTPLPTKIAIPMLEYASLEDDDTLQDVWSRLIANGTNPNFKEYLHPVYIEIVKQLSTDEAVILLFCSKYAKGTYSFSLNDSTSAIDFIFKPYITTDTDFNNLHADDVIETAKLKNNNCLDVYKDNLIRLQLLELNLTYNFNSTEYKLTAFGRNFITACICKIV